MADERCYRRGDDPTDLSTDTRYVFGDDDVFHGPWCRANAHQPNCIHSAYLRPGDAPDEDPQYGGNVLADLAAAEAQVARLTAVIRAALDDLEARDELSAMDGLRAALAPGEPSAAPGVLRSAACAQHGARLCATCAGFEGGSPYAERSIEE